MASDAAPEIQAIEDALNTLEQEAKLSRCGADRGSRHMAGAA